MERKRDLLISWQYASSAISWLPDFIINHYEPVCYLLLFPAHIFSWCIQLQHPLLQHQLNQAHLLSLHSHFLTTKKSIIITISLADLTSSSICHGVIFLCLIIWGETCSNRRSWCPSLLPSLYNWLTDCYLKSREQYQQYPWREHDNNTQHMTNRS